MFRLALRECSRWPPLQRRDSEFNNSSRPYTQPKPSLDSADETRNLRRANEKLSADVTFIPTEEGWLYLAVILDLFSRRVVAWSMDGRMPPGLTLQAFEIALVNAIPVQG